MEKLRLNALAGANLARLVLLAGMTALLITSAGCNDRDTSTAPPDSSAKAASEPAGQTAVADDCLVEPPPGPVACTMEWAPVCGCDGRTYGNACQARGAGVSRFTPGECGGGELD